MQNKWLKIILVAVGAVLALCILFGAGVFVLRWSSQSGSRPAGLLRRTFGLGAGHGAIGKIQTLGDQTITLELRDGTMQAVRVDSKTRIERNRKRITFQDLRVEDRIIVVGSPDGQGQIVAEWIHVFSPAPGLRVTPTLSGMS